MMKWLSVGVGTGQTSLAKLKVVLGISVHN